MDIGTASAAPGELDRGHLELTELPTGTPEKLPVIVANGEKGSPAQGAGEDEDGPTLWITGGVHGDEATGVAVTQDVMHEDLPQRISGAVVAVPVVNPAGLRRNARQSYYGDDDPNRKFPDPESDSSRPAEVQERIDERLYDTIVDSADALIDNHTAGVNSFPFVIRDRVLYGERRTEDEAEELADELDALVQATGLPLLTEYPAEEYVEMGLQRSTAGAVCNAAGIPAFTTELGGHSVVTEGAREAGVAAAYGVMDELGMLDDWPEEVEEPGSYDAPVDFPVRRFRGPRTETAGLVRHRFEAGDMVEEGEVVADVVSAAGEQIDTVEAEHDGYVIGRKEGLAAYEGDAVLSMAARDEGPLVAPRDADE
ncbi:succinylglutamate desuccinylase/aspartoacylase family protein [Halolamina salifodinae]|uniref:Putative deacylase n=1 Tax=Halolamina salifodinae TaxID=1202767 RepID=A0A8T4GZ41_9EURY|nr:succinylglutamate desuccinylase/aspartoacylase family protein [Halolamina salifodinae]MBP1988287.1 putative deacylase [Halolamina salifodinae]